MQFISLMGQTDWSQVSAQCFHRVGEPNVFAALKADIVVRIQWVVVAMETVNNPAAYTAAPSSVQAPIKAF